ncbi:MAG TPA: tetratricopeptide repeat protein [Candidatus Limnocylindrales bacterium]|nr:tetratricopeptide repeat protein [Candidatus Limnocylindrales bacterium]
MKKTKILIAAIVLVLIIGVGTFIAARNAYNNDSSVSSGSGRFATTDRLIQSLESRVQSNPKDADALVKLANAYLQKVRETADTSYYAKAEKAVNTAAQVDSKNPEIFATRAAVAYGRHDFKKGLELSQQAVALNPNRAAYHGLVGDGQLELGKYSEAIAAYQAMINIRPDLGAFNRIAHVREIYGDIEGAKTALTSAIQASSGYPENVAFSQVELGKLHLRTSIDEAEASFKQALATVPEYEPALHGLARVAVARGDTAMALKFAQQAALALPIAQYATDVGDIYSLRGDQKRAAQQYSLAKLAYQSSSKDGVNTDQEMALFLADNTREYEAALSKAQSAYQTRPNIYAADTLAWAHYKKGNNAEAKKFSQEALRLGEHDPLILYHAGIIAIQNDEPTEAKRYLTKALEIHPHFSIMHVPIAVEELKKL